MADLKPLIAYLTDQVRDQGGTPNKTALVKLVYLVDVDCWRKLGKSATGLEWRFHHYGPYSVELERDINDNAFLHVFGSRRSGYGFSISSDWRDIHAAFNTRFEPAVRRIADGVVRQWALKTSKLFLSTSTSKRSRCNKPTGEKHWTFPRYRLSKDPPAEAQASPSRTRSSAACGTGGTSAGIPQLPPARRKRLRKSQSMMRSTKRPSS